VGTGEREGVGRGASGIGGERRKRRFFIPGARWPISVVLFPARSRSRSRGAWRRGEGLAVEAGGDGQEGGGGLAAGLGDLDAGDDLLEGVQGQQAGVADEEAGAEVG